MILEMTPSTHNGPLLLFDGECGFCDATVQWILDHDPDRIFRMAALQGETAAAIMSRHPEIPDDLDSLILVESGASGEVLFWESRAVGVGARHLRFPWRILALVRWVPAFVADPFYRFIARHRLKLMGRLDSCRIPTPEEQDRFLP